MTARLLRVKKYWVTLLLAFTSFQVLSSELPERLPFVNASYQGTLNYIDYGNGKPVAIPLEIQFLAGNDGKTLIVDRVYTDPGFQVFSLSVMRYLKNTKSWIDETFEGNEQTTNHYSILEFSVPNDEYWKIIRTIKKQDNNRDAMLTIADVFDGDKFLSETRVDYLDTTENENLRRNWIELVRRR